MVEIGATFAQAALSAMLEVIDEGALLFEGDAHVCVAVSHRVALLLGLAGQPILGRPRDELLTAISAADEAAARSLSALRDAADDESLERTVTLRAEPPRTIDWATTPIMIDGRAVGRLDVLTDRTTESRLQAALADAQIKLAGATLTDELTGLANRRYFEQQIDREHRRAQRAWSSYAVARIDVDRMGALNERLGAETGDRLLRRLGEALRAPRREYDLVARWDKDELIVLLPGIDQRSVKAVVARSLSSMREAAREVTGGEVTFCAGIAVWVPPSVDAATDIVTRAGTALEAAQLMGAGSIEVDARMVEWKDELNGEGPSVDEAPAGDVPP